MQNVPNWPADSPVSVPSADVKVSGASRRILSTSVKASVFGASIAERTGEVAWAPLSDVSRTQDTILSPSAPRRGDRITVDAGDGDALARIMTGKVDVTHGAVPGGLVSELSDDWDQLGTEVDVPPMIPKMKPYQDEGPLRQIGLTATWVTQYVLAECGFRATPAGRWGHALTASLNGSLWPESGTLMESLTLPSFSPVPWGEAPAGFRATYEPGARSIMQSPLEIAMLVAPSTATANSLIYATYAGGNIRLTADANRAVRAQMSTGTAVTIVSLSTADMVGAEQVVLRVTSAGEWALTTDTGVSRTATAAIPAALQGAPQGWIIEVPSGGRLVGGVRAGFPETPGPAPGAWKRTAQLDPPDGTLAASRAIVSTPTRAVLQERADAERARVWIDSHGVLQWRSRGRWGTGAPVATITDVDLLGYALETDYDSAYSGATVSCLSARVEVRSLATILLYQGPRQVLNAGDVDRQWIEVPEGEDWPWIDSGMDILAVSGDPAGFNRGRRTWTGATRVSSSGEGDFWAQGAQGDYATFTFEKIDGRKWLHTITIGTGLPADQTIETRTLRPGNAVLGTAIWSQWDSFNLPVIRGYDRVTWLGEKRYGTAATTLSLPRLEHDCKWWVQGGAVQRLADWLATEYGAPRLTIKGLSVRPDARREIGDTVQLTDSTYGDLSATAVIAGIDYSTSDGKAAQTLELELQSVTSTRRTYDDVQKQAGSSTYAQFQALIGAVTYRTHEETP